MRVWPLTSPGELQGTGSWVAVLHSSMPRALVPAEFIGFINIYMEKHLKLPPASQMWKPKMPCSLCGLIRAGGSEVVGDTAQVSESGALSTQECHRRHQATLGSERGATQTGFDMIEPSALTLKALLHGSL